MIAEHVFLGIGTNQGDRLINLTEAKRLISEELGTILKESPIYETAAWGLTNQPDFLNQVIRISTALPPFTLMQNILQIEAKMGRVRGKKWAERNIDIDILFYDDVIVHSDSLTIPHPFVASRRFVLRPLTDIAPELVHPISLKTINELNRQNNDETDIRLFNFE